MSGKTLVAYESKSGATEESARKIADVFRSKFQLEVDLVDLGKQNISDCSLYQNIVVGSGEGWQSLQQSVKMFEK